MMSGTTVCVAWMGTFWGTVVQALPRHARRDITVTVAVPGWDTLFHSLKTVPSSLAHLMMLPLLDVLAGELDSEEVPLAQAAQRAPQPCNWLLASSLDHLNEVLAPTCKAAATTQL